MNDGLSTARPELGAEPADAVAIEIPAVLRYISLTRVAVASLAADLDADLDHIEDLRIAVNELVGLLVEAAGGGRIHLWLWSDDQVLHVHGRATGPAAPIEPDPLTRRILDATVDSYEIADGAFGLHKHLGTP